MINENEILVSISCITYNHVNFIRQCLDSLLMQQCNFNFEILIHDDASTDGTQEIIKEYQEKYPNIIKPILRIENLYSKGIKGFNAKFNYSRALGKYIAICEGDDYWTDSLKLQRQVDFLETNGNMVLTFHNTNRVNFNNEILIYGENTPVKYYSFKEMLHIYMAPVSFMFRNVKIDADLFQGKGINGDAVLLAILAMHGGCANLGFVGANYRIHNQGIYSKNDYLTNSLLSIQTRRSLISNNIISNEVRKELKKEIIRRKVKSLKFAIKRLKFDELFKILSS